MMRKPTQMRRRTVTDAKRIVHPEPGASGRRVTVTCASGNAPRVALAVFPYVEMPGDDPDVDDVGSFNRMDNPPSANAQGSPTGDGTIVSPGSPDDYGRAGRTYTMPVFDVAMLDICVELTDDQWIEAQAVDSGWALLVVTVEYP